MCKCNECLFSFSPKPNRAKEPKAETKRFFHNGTIISAKMKGYNDSFYEITEGKFKGNLVHTWEVLN